MSRHRQNECKRGHNLSTLLNVTLRTDKKGRIVRQCKVCRAQLGREKRAQAKELSCPKQ